MIRFNNILMTFAIILAFSAPALSMNCNQNSAEELDMRNVRKRGQVVEQTYCNRCQDLVPTAWLFDGQRISTSHSCKKKDLSSEKDMLFIQDKKDRYLSEEKVSSLSPKLNLGALKLDLEDSAAKFIFTEKDWLSIPDQTEEFKLYFPKEKLLGLLLKSNLEDLTAKDEKVDK